MRLYLSIDLSKSFGLRTPSYQDALSRNCSQSLIAQAAYGSLPPGLSRDLPLLSFVSHGRGDEVKVFSFNGFRRWYRKPCVEGRLEISGATDRAMAIQLYQLVSYTCASPITRAAGGDAGLGNGTLGVSSTSKRMAPLRLSVSDRYHWSMC
jgi:hypothetical protein